MSTSYFNVRSRGESFNKPYPQHIRVFATEATALKDARQYRRAPTHRQGCQSASPEHMLLDELRRLYWLLRLQPGSSLPQFNSGLSPCAPDTDVHAAINDLLDRISVVHQSLSRGHENAGS